MMAKIKGSRGRSWMVLVPLTLLISSCATQANMVDLELGQERLKLRQSQMLERLVAIERNSDSRSGAAQQDPTDIIIRLDQLSAELQSIQGRLEETSYLTSEISQRIDDDSFRTREMTDRLDIIDRQVMHLEESFGRISKPGLPQGEPDEAGSSVGAARLPDEKAVILPGRTRGSRPSPALSPSEAYGLAYNDYLKGNYELALVGFKNFLSEYKNTSLAPNAQYWIGESYHGKEDYQRAIEAFIRVVAEFPESRKVPGALLKTGYAYIQLADREKAEEYLKKVIEDYPFSDEANLAKGRLAELK